MTEGISPKLSVLLATVENRAEMFSLLHSELLRQSKDRSVELVVACDAKQISIGKKRQNLLDAAQGEYVCYVDDDDWVSIDYIGSILDAVSTKPDCVGFEIHCTRNGGEVESAIASLRYQKWGDNQDGYRYVRSIYHKTPVRREIALKVGFPDLRYGEDRHYSMGVQALCKTERFIKRVLYYYRYRNEPYNMKYGFHTTGNNAKGINYSYKRKPFQH